MKTRKINMTNVIAAAAGGAAYNAGITMAARMNGGDNFINNNFIMAKGVGGLVIGTGLVYFSKSEPMKAAGYGIIGAGGAAIANKIAFAGDQPAQGVASRLAQKVIQSAKPGQKALVKNLVAQIAARGKMSQPGRAIEAPGQKVVPMRNNYGNIAYKQACGY